VSLLHRFHCILMTLIHAIDVNTILYNRSKISEEIQVKADKFVDGQLYFVVAPTSMLLGLHVQVNGQLYYAIALLLWWMDSHGPVDG